MDITLLICFASLILLLIIGLTFFLQRKPASHKRSQVQDGTAAATGAPVRQIRRAAGTRNARRRLNANVENRIEETTNRSEEESDDEAADKPELPSGKIGAKKQAKLAAKMEKKQQREAAEREREERKKREQLLQEERDKQTEKEHAEQLRIEEAERKAREEKEKREYEEYLKMKEAFTVEEEGFVEDQEEDEENLLEEFISYIKQNKVVVLEDLAAHFGLKTAAVVERIQELQAIGNLTGVIDDRGKFIYISQSELEAIAKFVKQRGRVSITELAENSNNLINLNPGHDRGMVETR